MKRTFSSLALVLGLTANFGARAATPVEGGSVGNGGQTVDIEGRPTLRDLVDRTVCTWVRGDVLGQQAPHLANVYRSLDRLHPIYSALLRRQFLDLNFCVTEGELFQINPNDLDGLTVWVEEGTQVAIRVGMNVFLNRNIFRRLDEVNRAYLLIHEAMHGFLADDVPQRNLRLRSFVNVLRQNELSPLDPDTFFYQIAMNGIGWPSTRKQLGAYSRLSALEATGLDSQTAESERIAAYYALKSLQASADFDVFFEYAYPNFGHALGQEMWARHEALRAAFAANDVATVARESRLGMDLLWGIRDEAWRVFGVKTRSAERAGAITALLDNPSVSYSDVKIAYGEFEARRGPYAYFELDLLHAPLENKRLSEAKAVLDSPRIELKVLEGSPYGSWMLRCVGRAEASCNKSFLAQAIHMYGDDPSEIAFLLNHPRVRAQADFDAAVEDAFALLEEELCQKRRADIRMDWFSFQRSNQAPNTLWLNFDQAKALANTMVPYLKRAPQKCYLKAIN